MCCEIRTYLVATRLEEAQSEYGFSSLLHALDIYVESFVSLGKVKPFPHLGKVERRLIWSMFWSGKIFPTYLPENKNPDVFN